LNAENAALSQGAGDGLRQEQQKAPDGEALEDSEGQVGGVEGVAAGLWGSVGAAANGIATGAGGGVSVTTDVSLDVAEESSSEACQVKFDMAFSILFILLEKLSIASRVLNHFSFLDYLVSAVQIMPFFNLLPALFLRCN